jgi:hypothetical protein
MLLERGIPVTLGNISLVEVAERLQRTTGAAYNIWPSQVDFHRELAEVVCSETEWGSVSINAEIVAQALDEKVSWREVTRRHANAYLSRLSVRREFFTFVHFVAVALDEPTIAKSLSKGFDSFQEENERNLEQFLGWFSLELEPPFTTSILATSIASLAEGFLMRSRMNPSIMDATIERPDLGDAASGWSPFSIACERLITSMLKSS